MPCVWLKNGARINFSDEAFQDKDYMEVLRSEIEEDPPGQTRLSPKKEEQFKELREFIRSLSKGEMPKSITILKD